MALDNTNLIRTTFASVGFEKYSSKIIKGQTLVQTYTKTTTDAQKKSIKQIKTYNTDLKTHNRVLVSHSKVKETNAQMTKRLAKDQDRLNKIAGKGKFAMKDLTNAMKRAVIVAPIWLLLRSAMMKTIQLFKTSVKFLIDWEKQMAQIKIVGGATAEEYDRLSNSLLDLAKTYGTSLDQLGEGVKLWRQQGRAISEIAPLMKTTIKLSLLTGRTMSDTVEDMTAIMKNFGIEADSTGQILDSITGVMLNNAITSNTLVAALKDVSSIATQVGVSFHKLNGLITACFDDKTEILTNKGWKKYNEVMVGDFAMSLNPETKKMDYEKITDMFINKHYNGEMYRYKSLKRNRVDFLVTPDHKFPGNSLLRSPVKLKKIKDITKLKSRFNIPSAGKWTGKEQKDIIINNKKYSLETLLKFLGWFVSEGHVGITYSSKDKLHKSPYYVIYVSQSKKSKWFEELEEFLNEIFESVSYVESNRSFRIYREQALAKWLLEHCGHLARNKKIPSFIKELTPELIDIFVNTYCKGDGNFTNRYKSGTRRRFITLSKQLKDDISELILKLGYTPSISKTKPSRNFFKSRIINGQSCYVIYEDKKQIKCLEPKNIEIEQYKGIIWCPTVEPHHIVYMRRNGRCMWSGQTHVATRAAGGKIGKAWVTIFSRMGTTAVNAIQKIAQVPVYIDKTGQAVTKNTGVLRPMSQVLDEIAAKWSGLSNELQTQLGLQIAGRRRIQLFTSAMQQYDTGLKATLDSLDSFGKGQKATNVVLETTDIKIKQLINSWKKFIDTIADTSGLKATIDGLRGIVEHMEKMSAFGGLGFGTPETGKSFVLAKQLNKLREDEVTLLEEQSAKSRVISELASDLIQKIKTRNDLIKKGDELSKIAVKSFENDINKTVKALSKQKGFEGFELLPLEAIEYQLEQMEKVLGDKAISDQAIAAVNKQKIRLLDEMGDMQIQYNKIVEEMSTRTARPKIITDTVASKSLNDLDKFLKDVDKKIEQSKKRLDAGFTFGIEGITQTRITNLEASKKILEDMRKAMVALGEIGYDNVKTEFKRIKTEREGAKTAQITQDQNKKFQTELFNLKKKIINEDISEQEAIKLKIALQTKYGEAVANLSTMRGAELQLLKQQTDLQGKLSSLMVSAETDLFRMKGASESQTIKLRIELEKQLNLNQGIESRLKKQLDLEKAINQEKIKGNVQLSSRSIKLAEIGQRFGVSIAQDINKVLAGEIKFDRLFGVSANVFKDFFGSELANLRAVDYLKKGEGRRIDITEREQLDPKVITDWRAGRDATTQADLIEQKLKQIIPESITLPKVDIKTIVENITVNLPTGTLINMAEDIQIEVIKKIVENRELNKLLADNIRPIL